MKLSRLLLSGLCVLGVSACDRDFELTEPDVLDSAIRAYNAVPDTGALNFRFLDYVEPHTTFAQLSLRDSSGQYTQTHSGARTWAAFRFATTPEGAAIKVYETTFTLNPGENYTLWLAGRARSGANPPVTAFLTSDTPPGPGTGQWAARVMNLNSATAVDVYVYTTAGGVPATATFAGVAYATPTAYLVFPIGTTWNVRACPAGAANNAVTCVTRALAAGTAGSTTGNTQDPIAGTNISGSAFTFAVIPPGVAGSPAAAFTTMFVKVAVDRRPARTGP